MAGLLSALAGANPGALYGNALSPAQQKALAFQGLLGFAGGMAPYLGASRLPVQLGQAMAGGAGGMGREMLAAGHEGMNANLLGLQQQMLGAKLGALDKFGALASGLLSAAGQPAKAPLVGAGGATAAAEGEPPPVPPAPGGLLSPGTAPLPGFGSGNYAPPGGAGGMSAGGGLLALAAGDAAKHGVDPNFFTAQIGGESGFNPAARNPQPVHGEHATGIAQFLPSTARQYGVDPLNPVSALDGAATYDADLLKRAGGDYVKAAQLYGTLPKSLDSLTAPQQKVLAAAQLANQKGANTPAGLLGPAAAQAPSPFGALLSAQPPAAPAGAGAAPAPAASPQGQPAPRLVDPRAAAALGIFGGIAGIPGVDGMVNTLRNGGVPGWYLGQDGQLHPEAPNTVAYQSALAGAKAGSAANAALPAKEAAIGAQAAANVRQAQLLQPLKLQQAAAGQRERGQEQRQTFGYEQNLETNPNAVNFSPKLLPKGPGTTDPLPVPASPTHPIATTLPPLSDLAPVRGSLTTIKKQEGEWGDVENEWNNEAESNALAIQRFGAMAQAFKMVQTGAYTTDLAHFRAALDAAGIHSFDHGLPDPAQVQIALKNNFGAAIQTLKGSGNHRWTQGELRGAQEAMANPDMQPGANLEILGQVIGSLQWENAKIADYASAKRIAAQRGVPLNPTDWERAWVSRNPLQPVIDQAAKQIGPLKGMSAIPDAIRSQALDAIQRGAPRAAVMQRIQKMGYNPAGL